MSDPRVEVAPQASGPTLYALMILAGLQRKPVYAGTVPPEAVARRRAKNRRARAARRITRRRS